MRTERVRPLAERGLTRRERGLTIVELMVAVAISLFMVTALVVLYVNNSASRSELDRSSRQIENGRFAIDMLRDDIALAGYYGELSPREVQSVVEANPCATATADMGFTTVAPVRVPAPVQGLSDEIPPAWGCATLNQRADTGYLIVRRVSTGPSIAPASAVSNTRYLQPNGCMDVSTPFIFAAGPGATNFTLQNWNCTPGVRNGIRRYLSRMYYVADCGVCSPSDGVPTLKVRELEGNQIVERIIADGIEDLEFEYGLDTLPAGSPDGVVDSFVADATGQWANVVAVRIHLISRSTEASPGYEDTKVYDMGLFGAASAPAGATGFKRRAYSALVMLPNVAGPRETL